MCGALPALPVALRLNDVLAILMPCSKKSSAPERQRTTVCLLNVLRFHIRVGLGRSRRRIMSYERELAGLKLHALFCAAMLALEN